MAIERKFIADNIKKLEVKEYLRKELDRAGCGEIDLLRTPLGTRVIINAQRPGIVIGRKGASIRKLTAVLKTKYEIDNPQLEVNELEFAQLNAQVMAKNIASSLERGIHFRRAAYTTLRNIMNAGARGAEIQISGKLTGERAKSLKFTDGYLKHCGEPAIEHVRVGIAVAKPKPGVLGIKVKIMPPGVKLPDDIEFIKKEEKKEVKEVEETKGEVDLVKKPEKVGEEIEELVEDIQEELEVVVEGEAPKVKKLKPEKIKRKKAKKKDPLEEPDEDDLEEPGETPKGPEKKLAKKTKAGKIKAKPKPAAKEPPKKTEKSDTKKQDEKEKKEKPEPKVTKPKKVAEAKAKEKPKKVTKKVEKTTKKEPEKEEVKAKTGAKTETKTKTKKEESEPSGDSKE